MSVNSDKSKKIGLVGVPLGFAAEQIGSELGVEAMRLSSVRGRTLAQHIDSLGYGITDHGNVDIDSPRELNSGEKPKFLTQMITSSERIAVFVKAIMSQGEMPVILGGDHSIAIGTLSGISSYAKEQGKEIGLIWFDAHADINTPETSESGNIHGMPLATLLGYGSAPLVHLCDFAPKLNKKFCAHVGGRDLDAGEQNKIRELGMRDNFFTMSDIDKRGMLSCVNDAIDIASQASGGYAVTFDIDMIDPRFAPGSGTLVRGGTTYREAHLALETIAERGGMISFEIVEVNPLLDQSNVTVELACELILSALGKTIL